MLFHIFLYTNTFTQCFHQFFDAEILLPAGTFLHRDTLALHGDVFLHGEVAFTHTHARALAGMFLNARALTQRYFYTEMLWHRDAFTHRNACTYTHTYTRTLLHRDGFTLSNFTHRTHYKKTGVLVLFTKEWIYTKSFLYGCFCTGMLLHEFGGKGWPSASPHCHFMSIFGDRHRVRGGCVSWTSIHFALPP